MQETAIKRFTIRRYSTPEMYWRIEVYERPRGTLIDVFERPTQREAERAFEFAGYERTR